MASNATWKTLDLDAFNDLTNVAALVGFQPNQVFFVNSVTGSSSYNGRSRAQPKATIKQAHDLCDDAKGDVIVVMAGHTETLSATATTTLSKTGVTYLGYGNARNRPAITCGAGAFHGYTLSGANNRFKNLRFIGSDSQTGATSIINVTAADNVFEDCVFEHGAGPLRAITLTNIDRSRFERCTWIGTANGPDTCITMNGSCTNSVFRDLIFNYGAAGLDSGGIMTTGATTGFSGNLYKDILGIGMDLTLIDINASSVGTTCESLIQGCTGAFRAGVTITACIDGGGAALVDNFVTDAVAAAPVWTVAVDTAAANFPTATPA